MRSLVEGAVTGFCQETRGRGGDTSQSWHIYGLLACPRPSFRSCLAINQFARWIFEKLLTFLHLLWGKNWPSLQQLPGRAWRSVAELCCNEECQRCCAVCRIAYDNDMIPRYPKMSRGCHPLKLHLSRTSEKALDQEGHGSVQKLSCPQNTSRQG